MSEKLLPCPFCGAPADPPELYGESKTAMFVGCSKCGANVYHGTADKEANSAAVVVAWNRRASLPQPAAGSTWRDQIIPGTLEAFVARMKHVIDNYGSKLGLTDEKAAELAVLLTKDADWLMRAAHFFAPASTPAQSPAHDEGHPHLIGGEFQSDKYPTTPRGKVPLSVKDKTAQDLLWTYAQRRRVVDGEFANDLELALTKHGFVPSTPALCEDEGCPHYGTAHVCVSTPAQSVLMEALHKISNPFDHGHCGTCGKECAGATDCDCFFPVWEQDNPIAIAKAALSREPSQPAPVVADDLREAAIRDRAYVLGMRQALREVWPFIRENDRWWDALAKKLKELDARTDTLDKGGLRILLDSTSPQPDRESELERVVLRKAKILSQIWTSKGEVDDPDALIAISEVHDAICALYGVDPKVGFALTSSNRPQATERARSSTVEPSAHNGLVSGSSPDERTIPHSLKEADNG